LILFDCRVSADGRSRLSLPCYESPRRAETELYFYSRIESQIKMVVLIPGIHRYPSL
jgi:hypothetical protein